MRGSSPTGRAAGRPLPVLELVGELALRSGVTPGDGPLPVGVPGGRSGHECPTRRSPVTRLQATREAMRGAWAYSKPGGCRSIRELVHSPTLFEDVLDHAWIVPPAPLWSARSLSVPSVVDLRRSRRLGAGRRIGVHLPLAARVLGPRIAFTFRL